MYVMYAVMYMYACMHMHDMHIHPTLFYTAILIIIEGHETAFNSFLVPVYNWKTVGKSETDPQLL
jgi:hypothetical protein